MHTNPHQAEKNALASLPNPQAIHPIPGYENEIYVKPTITNPHIIVGDFTYIADSEFENHVTHLYDWNEGGCGHFLGHA